MQEETAIPQRQPVFSPSATSTFSVCPRKWALERMGYVSRTLYYPELCAVLGDGFSECMRLYNTALATKTPIDIAAVTQAGQAVMRTRLDAAIEAGRRIHEKDQDFADLLTLKLEQAVSLYVAQNPLKAWTMIHAEHTYADHGSCRIDVLADPNDGLGPVVVDYKVKVKLDKAWEDAEFDKHSRSQQRFHYQWAAKVQRFFICLVVLGASRDKSKPRVVLGPPYGESMYFNSGLWLADSQHTWNAMHTSKQWLDAGGSLSAIGGSHVHEDKWGPCKFEEGCLSLGLNRAAMSIPYVQIERRKSV